MIYCTGMSRIFVELAHSQSLIAPWDLDVHLSSKAMVLIRSFTLPRAVRGRATLAHVSYDTFAATHTALPGLLRCLHVRLPAAAPTATCTPSGSAAGPWSVRSAPSAEPPSAEAATRWSRATGGRTRR